MAAGWKWKARIRFGVADLKRTARTVAAQINTDESPNKFYFFILGYLLVNSYKNELI